jgi:hypothetical protein
MNLCTVLPPTCKSGLGHGTIFIVSRTKGIRLEQTAEGQALAPFDAQTVNSPAIVGKRQD